MLPRRLPTGDLCPFGTSTVGTTEGRELKHRTGGEMADALALGARARKGVWVRLPPRPQNNLFGLSPPCMKRLMHFAEFFICKVRVDLCRCNVCVS